MKTGYYVVGVCCLTLASLCAGALCPIPNGNNVTFPDVSASVAPVVSDLKTTYDAQGLQPFFDLANSFMNTVQSKSIQETFTKNDFEKLSSEAVKDKLVKYETPIAVTAGVGMLFALFMPIVGLCFCCCRCCGNCGGEMVQKEKDANNHTKCCICSFVHLVLVIFLLCGVLFMFVCTMRLKTAVTDLGPNYIKALDEGINYANTTVAELKLLANDQLECAIDLVLADISDDGIKKRLGVPFRDAMVPTIGVALDAVIAATTDVSAMESKLQTIRNTSAELKTNATALGVSLSGIKTRLTTVLNDCEVMQTGLCSSVDANSLDQDASFNNLPDVNTELDRIQSILQQNFTGAAQEGKAVFDNIPKKVADRSTSTRNGIRDMVNDGKLKLKNTVNNLTKDIDNSLINQKQDYVKYRDDYQKDVDKYDKYRNYAFLGLSGIAALICLCVGLGLTCGVCGYKRHAEPTHRSSLSHCGGNCLMAGVGFMFIFAFILMLFTVLSFVTGIHLHIACKEIKDATIIDKYTKGSIKFDNQSISVAGILRSCRNNEPIYTAINGKRFLDVDDKVNITKLVGNVNEEIDKLNVNLTDQSILNSATRTALTDLSTSQVDNIDFAGFFAELRKGLTKADLVSLGANITTMADALRTYATLNPLDSAAATALATNTDAIVEDINTLRTGMIADMTTQTTKLDNEVTELSTLSNNLQNVSLDILKKLEDADNYLKTNAGTVILQQITLFSARVMGWMEQFADHIKIQITSKISRCQPIANLYDSVIGSTLCGSLVGNFNGFWLALGWCLFFFIPLIIFSVKLAKFFRRMKCLDGFGNEFHTYPSMDRGGSDKIPLQQMDQDRPPPYENNGYSHRQ